MRGTTVMLGLSTTLIAERCWECDIWFAIPDSFAAKKGELGTPFYCPNGHSLRYGRTVKDQLERERQAHQATRDLLRHEERRLIATRGHLTRHKRRAQAGVCPCCNRTFQQLARHMKTKHPEFKAEA